MFTIQSLIFVIVVGSSQPYCKVAILSVSKVLGLVLSMSVTDLDDFIALASSDLPSRRQGVVQLNTGNSFGGYSNLLGEILTIPVTKVNKKLGMAIDGGANTKQQAVTIRQITVS